MKHIVSNFLCLLLALLFLPWAAPAALAAKKTPEIPEELLEEGQEEALREWCAAKFEGSEVSDPAEIPWPENRLEDGYLPEGAAEFIYDDAEKGLWGYLSSSLQVQIVKHQIPEVPHLWYEAEVIFKPDQEAFTQHIYVNASFKNQEIYPETLAQTSKLVFAVNGDYHKSRVEKKLPIGNIIRHGEVLYTHPVNRSMKFPNLDTLAIHSDGSFSVSAGKEYSAEELLAQGDVTDALSFGPYLVRDGVMRVYDGDSAEVPEPRMAYGMISPGHLYFVMVEGKMPKKGEQGFDLWLLADSTSGPLTPKWVNSISPKSS